MNQRSLADGDVSSSYDAFFRHHPDCTGIKALSSFAGVYLDLRSDAG